jgi:uncharacterized RDD family membrane protein YckC
MSHVPPVAYASPNSGQCPVCQIQPVGKFKIYSTPTCKQCYYAFTNRRQGAYLLDAILFIAIALGIGAVVGVAIVASNVATPPDWLLNLTFGIPLTILFAIKDGFGGYSPGKWLLGLRVLDATSGQPISVVQSAKRNAYAFLSLIPFVGPLAQLVVVLIIAFTVGRGFRILDRFANTRVIWTKHAMNPVFYQDQPTGFEVTTPTATPIERS